jgi:hypothetical protein
VITTTICAFVPTPTAQIAMSVTESEERCNVLRLDLKVWEKKFAAQNNGRKAGRDDIKADEEICMHATYSMIKTFQLTDYSAQIQRVQQASGQYSSSGRPADTLEENRQPSKHPQYRANTKATTNSFNRDTTEEEERAESCVRSHPSITRLLVTPRTQCHRTDPTA